MPRMRNIELKARLRDIESATVVCRQIGATYQREVRQTDTYFNVSSGRLKLRQNVPGNSELIFYHRADMPESRGSDYEIVPASPELARLLSDALGVCIVVTKSRTLWLWHNVRIHLDEVDHLGTFIEFEAVLNDVHDDTDGHRKIVELQHAFCIRESDFVACSYRELLLEKMGQ